MMKIIYAFLTFVAIACARPSRQPQQQSNSVTFENQETQNLVNVIKKVNHLTDDDIAEGFLMIKELDDKTQELVAHGKEKYEDFLQLSMLLKESAEQQLLEYEMEAEKLKEKELPFNFNDDGNSESISSLLPILMMTNALGDESGSVNPLLLMTLMKDEGNSMESLLPVLLMNGGIGNRDNSMNPLLLMTLFNENSDGGVDTDMLLPMLLSGGSSGGNMSSLLPFVLMSEDNEDDGDDTLLLFLLLNMQATS